MLISSSNSNSLPQINLGDYEARRTEKRERLLDGKPSQAVAQWRDRGANVWVGLVLLSGALVSWNSHQWTHLGFVSLFGAGLAFLGLAQWLQFTGCVKHLASIVGGVLIGAGCIFLIAERTGQGDWHRGDMLMVTGPLYALILIGLGFMGLIRGESAATQDPFGSELPK
jgi:hypothetical protein